MALEIPTLKATRREVTGKSDVKRLRESGWVPGVYYYAQNEPVVLQFDEKDIRKLFAGRRGLINLVWGEKDDEHAEVMVREVQRHPVSKDFLHLDLVGITRGVKMSTTVPLVVTGTPVGVRDQGGILQQIIHEVEIMVLPKDLPEVIEVDVAGLNLGDSIHLGDIEIENVEWVENVDRTIVTVVAPRVIEEEVEEEAEEGEEGEEGVEGEESEESAAEASESEGE